MALFSSQEMRNSTPRAQMLDGFNAGWIDFEYGEAKSTKGTIDVEAVLRALVQRPGATDEYLSPA